MTSQWSLIFVIALIAVNLLTIRLVGVEANGQNLTREPSGYGGPLALLPEETASLSNLLIYPISSLSDSDSSLMSSMAIEEGLAVAAVSPLSNASINRHGLMTYKVAKGDTLSGLAARFGISVDTLFWANPGLKSALSVGQELVILPVSGILYQIQEGDTLEGILSAYQVNQELFENYNPNYQKIFGVDQTVILPYAKPLRGVKYSSRSFQRLPDLGTYFVLPARGWNWGVIHDFNAVDIADECGQPIYAAAEGLVIEESGDNRWNNGYGNYVLIEHPNGVKTKYAHTLKNLVTVGDYVAQGDQIALIGNTGNTHGPTGCHLHFEVYGAKNPFGIR